MQPPEAQAYPCSARRAKPEPATSRRFLLPHDHRQTIAVPLTVTLTALDPMTASQKRRMTWSRADGCRPVIVGAHAKSKSLRALRILQNTDRNHRSPIIAWIAPLPLIAAAPHSAESGNCGETANVTCRTWLSMTEGAR